MIVDTHRHLWSGMERYASARQIAAASPAHFDSGAEQPSIPDLQIRANEILLDTATARIDHTVLVVGDYGLRLGEGILSIGAENEMVANLAKSDPGNFTAAAGVDPRRQGAAELMEQAIGEWGAKAIKIHPGAGFSPADPVCYPLYEIALSRGVPVLIHTGPAFSPLLSETSRPALVDQVAADFPDMTIVLQHAGQMAWWKEAVNIALWKPNIVLEISMWQWLYLYDEPQFAHAFGQIKALLGTDRVMFGSDAPGMSAALALKDWVDAVEDLPRICARHGVDISEREAALVLGENAARVFDISL